MGIVDDREGGAPGIPMTRLEAVEVGLPGLRQQRLQGLYRQFRGIGVRPGVCTWFWTWFRSGLGLFGGRVGARPGRGPPAGFQAFWARPLGPGLKRPGSKGPLCGNKGRPRNPGY